MRQLKSSAADLRHLFEVAFLVRHIAEDVEVCCASDRAESVARTMASRDFDFMPVEHRGAIIGYVERSSLGEGLCKAYLRPFEPIDLLTASQPLSAAVIRLRDLPRVYVRRRNRVVGIVTRGDMQKAPVRMWLFGLVTLLEMQFLRLVRNRYPRDSWANEIPPSRLQKCREEFERRRGRNEEIDLADCLQFGDKRDLLFSDVDSCTTLGFTSKKVAERTLRRIETLRNNLAHAQDLVAGTTWPEIIDLAAQMERTLTCCEQLQMPPTQSSIR